MVAMRGASSRMRFGVKAWLTRPRRRVCSGGSITIMLRGTSSGSKPGGVGKRLDHVFGSRRIDWQSA